MTRRRSRRGVSAPRTLLPGRYEVSVNETVLVRRATHAEVDVAQRAWEPLRDPGAAEAHWNWRNIMSGYPETGAVVAADTDEILVMWAGRLDVIVDVGPALILAYLEVHPRLRGSGRWGPLALAVVCARAVALDRPRIGLASFPERVAWYSRAGAVAEPGLNGEPGLVTLRIDETWVRSHARKLDGIRQEEEGT